MLSFQLLLSFALCVHFFSSSYYRYFVLFFEKCVVGFGIWNVCVHMDVSNM